VKGDRSIQEAAIEKKQPVLCDVEIFPLRVNHEQQDWPEKHERSRIWVAPGEAAKLFKSLVCGARSGIYGA
jgi:hypothetical protein